MQGVKVVLAVLENGRYSLLAQADGTPSSVGGTHAPNHIAYNLKFQSSELVERAGERVYVFAFANSPANLNIADALENGTLSIEDADKAAIWAKRAFFMTNYSITSRSLPVSGEMSKYDENNPFDLGVVEIERVSSRFDFRATNNNVYPIKEVSETAPVKANVVLKGMAMVNIAKEYYVLPRTSKDTDPANAVICAPETPNNYVVSPNQAFKLNPVWANSATYFFNNNGTFVDGFDFETLTYTSVESVLGNDEDNDENWNAGEGVDKTGYRIWRYATENTVLGIDEQVHGISTGVYFKTVLEAAEGNDDLKAAMEAKSPLYALNGVLYGDKAAVEKYIENNKVSTLAEEWAKAAVADNVDANGDLLGHGDSNITIYRADANGDYAMYYCYYNRHNNNGDNNVMGPMEFAPVRNNVYKLAVTNIMRYGHPGKPGDDPDPENPPTPNETPETWFTVELHVLPWVVRVNNIEF